MRISNWSSDVCSSDLAAERQLAAATADIGVAVADLYPKFSLTGAAQLISTSLASLLESDSIQATGSGAVSFPLLDWGKRKTNVGIRREDREQIGRASCRERGGQEVSISGVA